MLLKDLQQKLSVAKKGAYHGITYKKESETINGDTLTTITTSVIRTGLNYYNVVKKQPSTNATKQNNTITIIKDTLIKNLNTGNTSLRCYVSKNPKHHTKKQYIYNGKEIDKLVAQSLLKKQPNPNKQPTEIFNINIDNIVSFR